MGRRAYAWTLKVSLVNALVAAMLMLPAPSALAEAVATLTADHAGPEADALLGQGREAAEHGAFDRAVVCFRQSLEINPRSGAAWTEMGCALADLQRWSEARGAFERALAGLPNDPAALNGLGYVHFRMEHTADAIQCYKAALSGRNDPQYHLNLGLAYLAQESWGQAVDEFRTTVGARPNDYWGQNNLGFALQHAGQWRQAAVSYQAAIGLAQNDVTAHLNLGALLLDARSFEDAATIYADALRHQDKSAEGHLGLAVAFAELGRPSEAQREARVSVSLAPGKAKAHHLLGEIYVAKKQWLPAIKALQRAVALAPEDAGYTLTLARCFEGAGRLAEAEKAYEAYLSLVPEGPEARDARMHARLLK